MNEPTSQPYKSLGTHLKYLREQLHESLDEVSGAVEIDADRLERIEHGQERPSEDILMLLINHFNMQDHEAVQLWELAGYDGAQDKLRMGDDIPANAKQIVMLLAMDARTMYTDGVDVNATPSGVTLSFTQASGTGERMPVARVGMSLEQAENVSRLLQRALLHVKYGGPKGLPPAADKN
ncbi:MAG TPA: helix-turn-helix transcriptional regulator [Candidatus Saccharimonadales bacterium]|nr:helix-turn-helix transcriptional regulator [Candidatus Saccharimonadales bacterium]